MNLRYTPSLNIATEDDVILGRIVLEETGTYVFKQTARSVTVTTYVHAIMEKLQELNALGHTQFCWEKLIDGSGA